MLNTETASLPFDEQNPHIKKFLGQIQNPFLQGIYMLAKVPSAFFMGVRVRSVTTGESQVSIPYKWRSQNPFKSTYFAAQAAAAEMSTGVLAMLALQGRGKVSMLITKMEGSYGKKANRTATFTCKDGNKVAEAVIQAIETGEPREVIMLTIGTQAGPDGTVEEVSRFQFTWSFKVKNK
jgi:hypothetical protein